MGEGKREDAAHQPLGIPIRVIGTGFTEETCTLVVNQGGAHVSLTNSVAAGQIVHILNLQNSNEADFCVIGPLESSEAQGVWGIECIEQKRNIWGIDLPPSPHAKLAESEASLECRDCHDRLSDRITVMQAEVLASTGRILRHCYSCARPTYWTLAQGAAQPHTPPGSQTVSLAESITETVPAKRAHKRLPINLPVLVRSQKNEQENTKTQNVSKGGLAVALGLELAVGDTVDVICPYSPGAQNIPQKARVRWRSLARFNAMWSYGLAYITEKT
jgi:hypothetical protein